MRKLNTFTIQLEVVLCIFKIYCFIKILTFYGILKGLLMITAYISITNLFLSKIFKLQKLTTNDILLLGFTNVDSYNMICTFFFDKMDKHKIRELLIEKGIKKVEKLRKKIV